MGEAGVTPNSKTTTLAFSIASCTIASFYSELAAATVEISSVETNKRSADNFAATSTAIVPSFPYTVSSDDHCESPLVAYQDIQPFLRALGAASSKTKIYDPYYCDGAAKRHMNDLGFPNVYHQKEDCYAHWGEIPFDILCTNPPYSDNHLERLVQFAVARDKPFFLLLPQFVHKKPYYIQATQHIRPFYLVPQKRYVYLPPPSFRPSKQSDTHKKSSPFVSMWYCYGGSVQDNDRLVQLFYSTPHQQQTCDLARSKSALRDLRRKKR